MAFITKAQAAAIQQAAVTFALATLPDQFEAKIRSDAAKGLTSVTFSYFPATSAQADAFITSTLTPAGWTAVNNNIATPGNFTITVS